MINQGSHGPAQQVKVQGQLAAMQGEIQKVAAKEIQKLDQNRDAASTRGDLKPHQRGNPNANDGDNRPSSGATHGLSETKAKHIIQPCHDTLGTLPEGQPVRDGHEVKDDGKAAAQHCNKCCRFAKGKTMHTGEGHKGHTCNKPQLVGHKAKDGASPAVSDKSPEEETSTVTKSGKGTKAMIGVIPPPSQSTAFCTPTTDPKPTQASILQSNLSRTAPPSCNFGAMLQLQDGVMCSVSSDSTDNGGHNRFLALLKEQGR